jgi:alkylation response protein AidB-like acyl-CoA dehydrogenase
MKNKSYMKGGAFIYTDSVYSEVYIPEDFDEEQKMIRAMILDFIDQEVNPHLDTLDSMTERSLMPSILKKSASLGMLGVNIPEMYGGMDLNMVTTLIFGEATAYGHSFATSIGAHTSIGSLPIVYYGNDAQKAKYLPGLADGTLMASYCLTEPNAGSDANSGKTKAILNEAKTHYSINGQKMWITNGGFANIFIVFAKIDTDDKLSAFIVEKDFNGITLGEEEKKMGIKGSSTIQVFFNDCLVPKENLLGNRQEGFKMALNILNSGRIKIGASAVGGCKLALKKSTIYAQERVQFNSTIAKFGAIKNMIANMYVKTFAVESATYRIGALIDEKYTAIMQDGISSSSAKISAIREYAIECSIAKVYGSDVLCNVCDESIQIHGGMGYAVDTGVERGYRDARITKIYEGTNEVNRLLIVGELLKRSFQTKEIKVLSAIKSSSFKALILLVTFASLRSPSIEKRISLLKDLFLLLTGGVANKFKKSLIEEQEIVMHLSDILIQTYVLESCYLRVEKLRDQKTQNMNLYDNILEVLAYESFERVRAYAKEIINSFSSGVENKILHVCVSSLIPNFNINIKENRREIAEQAYHEKGYFS